MLVAGAAAMAVMAEADLQAELAAAMRRGYVAAFRWLGTAEQAHDACQEAAARALSAAGRYDPSRPFYPWFYRILKNHCLDRLARRRRVVTSEATIEKQRSSATTAETQALDSERGRAVARAIAELPDELREMIELRHFQDASYQEMAELLGCPLGTVMSRLYRARKALRAKLLATPTFRGEAKRSEVEP